MASLTRLIPLLIEKTRERKLRWAPLSNGLSTSIGDNWVVVENQKNNVILSLFNINGRLIESIQSIDSASADKLEELHITAQNSSLGIVDHSIEEVEQLLKAM